MCGCVFDIEKVYDGTWLIKLYHMGTKGKMFKWIRSFLTSRKIAGSLGKNLTENLRVANGTSKGSNISPNLSSVMINGIFWSISSSIGVSLFADDRAPWKGGQMYHLSQESYRL